MSRLRYVLAAMLALLLAGAGLLLSAPWWIDSAAVKNEIARLASNATGDEVTIDRLALHYFPSISVQISRPRYVSAPGVEVLAESAAIDLDTWALLSGRTRPRHVSIEGLRVTLRLPPPAPEAAPFSAAAAEREGRAAIEKIVAQAPGLSIDVRSAIVAIQQPGRDAIELRVARAHAQTSASGIAGDLSCSSAFFDSLAATFSVDTALRGQGRVEFAGLSADRLAALAGIAGPAAAWSIGEAQAIGRADWKMQGLSSLELDAFVSLPRVVVYHQGDALAIEGVSAAADARITGSAYRLHVERLYLREPHALLAGSFARDASGRFEATVQAWGVDLAAAQKAVLALAPGTEWLTKAPVRVTAGTLTALDLHAQAATPAQLFELSALKGEGAIEAATVRVVRPAIELSGAGGRVTLDGGSLRVGDARAALGRSVVHHANFAIGLAQRPISLDGDAFVDVDIGETVALARRLIADQSTREQLDAVETVEGKAAAHVTLSGNADQLESRVDLSNLAVFVQHRYLPLPLRLTGGQLTYAKGSIGVRDLAGYMGRSAFSDLDASVGLARPHPFEISQTSGTLSLEEAIQRAAAVPALKSALAEIGNASGSLSISGLRASGSLEQPAATRFHVLASPHEVKFLSRRLATDVVIDGGSIELTDRTIEATEVGISTPGSSLRISARVDGYRDGPGAMEATVDGEAGAALLERLYDVASVPSAARPQAPLRFRRMRFAVDGNRELTVAGQADLGGSVGVTVDATAKRGAVTLKSASIRDSTSDAHLSGAYADSRLAAAFRGKLTGATLAAAMQAPPLALGAIEGDFAANVSLDDSMEYGATGNLQGTTVAVPIDNGAPLTVERFALKADGDRLRVEQATLSRDGNRFEVSGDLHRSDGKWIVDADVRADRVVIAQKKEEPPASEPGTTDTPASKRGMPDLSKLPFAGRIGVDIRDLKASSFRLAPLVAEARLAGRRLDLHVTDAALCGIGLSGNLQGEPGDLQLDGALRARNSDLKETIACLTDKSVSISGRLDLDAQFKSHGSLHELEENLDGAFSAAARDGSIEQFETLNRIFALLNITETMRGQKLHISGGGLPYRKIEFNGRLSQKTVHLEHGMLDGPTVRVAATGNLHYDSGKLAMDVLVAPLHTVDTLLDHVPLLNRIFGASILALPVRVAGTTRDPLIVPLGPGAVASRMTSIIANTLRLPVDAIKVVAPVPKKEVPGAPAEAGK